MRDRTTSLGQEKKQTLASGGLQSHTAVRSVDGPGLLFPAPVSGLGHDLSRVPAGGEARSLSCGAFPRTCPFGGACHTCPARVQAKLAINEPGDVYEQEADRVADTIMRLPAPEDEEEKPCSRPGCSGTVQRQAAGSSVPHSLPPIVHNALRSPGQPLDASTRAFMEPRFGRDLDRVRVHTDEQAAESARAISAVAYTLGNDLVFGAGQYAPQTNAGKRLVAHEVAHSLQQGRSHAARTPASVLVERGGGAGAHEVARAPEAGTRGDHALVAGGLIPSEPSIQRTCDPGPIASLVGPGGCRPLDAPVFPTGPHPFKFNISCDDFSPHEEDALKAFAGTQPAGTTFEIHGFASLGGPLSFNEDLSCARAHKARQVLTDPPPGGAGIAASRITAVRAHGPTPGPAADRQSVVLIPSTPPTAPTVHRFRVAGWSFLSCATCNPFTDDGTLGVTPPPVEPPLTSTHRQMHFIEAELGTLDGRTIVPGSARLTGSGNDAGVSHFCHTSGRGHIVSVTPPGAPTVVTSPAGVQGIELESEMSSRVGASVPPTLLGSPCGFLGTSPMIPVIGNRFKLRLFANGTKESEFGPATLYPSHFLYEDGALKMSGGAPVHPRQDFVAWATSTGAPLSVSLVGFAALRFACCSPATSARMCGTVCVGGFSVPGLSFSTLRHGAHAASLAASGCPAACAPAGASCTPLTRPSNP